MPRKRKGISAGSSRQLRRLAQQRTQSDLHECNSSSHALNSQENINIAFPADTVKDCTLPLEQSCSEVQEHYSQIKEGSCEVGPECSEETVIINLQQVALQIDCEPRSELNITDNEPLNICENNEGGSDENNDSDNDCPSISSDEGYRYSDSDADSIPDTDICDIDFDINLEVDKNKELREELSHWAKQYQIPQNALKSLLTIFNEYTDTKLPKDPRTLLQTPKVSDVIDMDSGQYCHIGVEKCVKNIIESRAARNMEFDSIKLLVNIDGAPIVGNSSEKGLWVILIKDSVLDTVYLVGVYCGTKKPQYHNVFLNRFVHELSYLITNGYTYCNTLCQVRLHGLICDAPAKSFILCTKYHSGYCSCSKCTIDGKYFSSVCFPIKSFNETKRYCNDLLRTDLECRNLKYLGDYQRGDTVFNQLPHFGLVSNVPLDCMHLVYLGVMKQIIRHWIGDKGRRVKIYRLLHNEIELISKRLEQLKHILPSDFNRRSRSLQYWKQWKATEFRHFLLYCGPSIVKDVVSSDVYNNFLKLHISMIILSNKILLSHKENIRFVESLLIEFVNEFQKIYGKENVTFNVHNLLHICKDVEKFGAVDSFSAFPFESYICSLKKLIRKGDKPLQQIARRLSEYDSIRNIKNVFMPNEMNVEKVHYHGLLTNSRKYEEQYKILITKTTRININDDRNNCVMLVDGSIINVVNIAKSCEPVMKKYAIILNENNEKLVIPSSWISDDSKYYYYPPSDASVDIKQAVIHRIEYEKEWSKLPFIKVIKYNDNYTTAVSDKRIEKIDEFSYPSDSDQLLKSRSKRNKKPLPPDFVSSVKKSKRKRTESQSSSDGTLAKQSKNKVIESEEDSDDDEDTDKENGNEEGTEKIVGANSTIPSQMNIMRPHNDNEENVFKSYRNNPSASPTNRFSTSVGQDTSINASESYVQNEELDGEESVTLEQIFGIQKTILKKVNTVLLKQEHLEKMIHKSNHSNTLSGSVIETNNKIAKVINTYFPIDVVPEHTNKKIEVVEEKLKDKSFFKCVIAYMKSLGGTNAHDVIINIFTRMFEDESLLEYSFKGQKKNEKGEKNKAFSVLTINTCIYQATRLLFPNVSEEDAQKSISLWLDQAKTRVKRQKQKNSSTSAVKPFVPLQICDSESETEG